jgi:thiamine-phosphate pyrophosphorylase
MTDERMGAALFDAIAQLPRGSGIVFRHYSLPRHQRAELLRQVQKAARARRHVVTIGGTTHGRRPGCITAPVHSIPEAIAAERAGAKLLFVSPVFATQSHPGAKPLGRIRFGLLIRGCCLPIIALGGMTAKRARSLAAFNIDGWAAIDGLTPQKRKAVPT